MSLFEKYVDDGLIGVRKRCIQAIPQVLLYFLWIFQKLHIHIFSFRNHLMTFFNIFQIVDKVRCQYFEAVKFFVSSR